MTSSTLPAQQIEARARQSLGNSAPAIYRMVKNALEQRVPKGGTVLDVGCGTGNLWPFVQPQFNHYAGVDVVQYEGFPKDAAFHQLDLDSGRVPLPDGYADVVVAVETIEHLENPRAFMRELVRLTRPGGWTLVTTPNQLSLLSKITLVMKDQFNAFQDSCYPAHLTALLAIDMKRIAAECGLTEVGLAYSQEGRIILTPWHYPWILGRWFPKWFSDNVLLLGRKPGG